MRQVNANGLLIPAYAGGESETTRTRRKRDRCDTAGTLGANLIDTAEMYGGGRELLIGRALRGIPRDKYILVSKSTPTMPTGITCSKLRSPPAGWAPSILTSICSTGAAPSRSRRPSGMEKLVRKAKSAASVSNFDTPDMQELADTQR